jgi:PAS domain S-box-containing protein
MEGESGTFTDDTWLQDEDKGMIIRGLLRVSHAAVFIVKENTIRYMNDALCGLTGYSREELQDKDPAMLFPSQGEYESLLSEIAGGIKNKGIAVFEAGLKTRGGETISTSLSAVNMDPADGSKGLIISALDISGRKKDEDVLRMQKMQLQGITSNIPVILYQYYYKSTGQRGFYYISESVEKVFGLKNDTGKFFHEFVSRVSPEYREKFLQSVYHAERNRTPWEFEGIFNRDSGDSIWFRVESKPVSRNGEVIFNGIGIDITENIKYLELSERAYKLDSLARLAGGIAHEFNNLLAGIFGYVEMARNYSRSDRTVSGYLDSVMQIFDRSKALTGQLLTFAKGGEPVMKSGSISETVIDTAKYILRGSDHTCDFYFPDDLWLCDFDREQISVAFENLITNAVQAMQVGGLLSISGENIMVEPGRHTFIKPGMYVRVSIRDSGPGIPWDLLQKIFDPFFTTKQKSRGMGLSTCHSIIRRHNGYIDVESDPGRGAVFHVYLPASSRAAQPGKTAQSLTHSGSGNILIMDDEIFIRETAGEMLRVMGYTVFKAADGSEALKIIDEELAKGTVFSAIILDLTVQHGMGGKEAINIIKEKGLDVPVFASSGYSDDPVISRPAQFGFTDSLRKPYRMEELAVLLNSYLTGKPV